MENFSNLKGSRSWLWDFYKTQTTKIDWIIKVTLSSLKVEWVFLSNLTFILRQGILYPQQMLAQTFFTIFSVISTPQQEHTPCLNNCSNGKLDRKIVNMSQPGALNGCFCFKIRGASLSPFYKKLWVMWGVVWSLEAGLCVFHLLCHITASNFSQITFVLEIQRMTTEEWSVQTDIA